MTSLGGDRSFGRLLASLALAVGGLGAGAVWAPLASAKPPAPAAFCQTYPDSKSCATGFTECATCHTTAPARNAFGTQLSERLAPGTARPLSDQAFVSALPSALKMIEGLDADEDGFSNLSEIRAGTRLASADSFPKVLACAPGQASKAGDGRWNVCGYDPNYAFRKISLDFCGRSPNRAEAEAFRKIKGEAAQKAALGDALDRCLVSKYWLGTNGVVWNLANAKIRPASVIKSGEGAGPVPLADYDDDYNLFTWANSGDRDVRDVLKAQYFVRRVTDDPVALEMIPEVEVSKRGRATRQPVPAEKRAGLITTRWFAASNTMFTAIPRTTAAQAYRAYLGWDIAKMQGLLPVSDEPHDYDSKGVKAAECAVCHTTLDPLTYPFTRYNGIGGGYTYDDDRLKAYIRGDGPAVVNAPKSGIILGKPVKDLVEWADVAANSDPFAMNVVRDYWKVLVGREPEIQDEEEFSRLWRGLKDPARYNYRVEPMLHDLVLTTAYGRP